MNNYKEWIIQYHGNLKKALQGTYVMIDMINEKYAIITARDEQIPYLRGLVPIEHIEESRPISEVPSWIEQSQIISTAKQRLGVSGEEVTIGWIGHKMNINHNNYRGKDGKPRIHYMHDGAREYSGEQIRYIRRGAGGQSQVDSLSPIDMCIGNRGIAPNSHIILVNFEKDRLYTADAIRAIRYIIKKIPNPQTPLVICFSFDIREESWRGNNLVGAIVSDMTLWGKIAIVSSLDNLDELLKLLYPAPVMKEFRTLDIAYEFAPEDAIIDAFVVYNSANVTTVLEATENMIVYPLVFPYFGVRGPVVQVKEVFERYLGKTATGFLSFILGIEPLNIAPTDFKTTSILKQPVVFKGKGTLIGIIDTGIDYTNPAFIDFNGESRIISIWDQTIGDSSPYGYGTIYDEQIINTALKSPDPFKVVPHKDEWGHGTILAGIAGGSRQYEDGTYTGVAPEAEFVIVKLKPATPVMQEIYYGKYSDLGFSALDIALAFQFLASLANEQQKPISICLPAGTNSGPHDGTDVLDTVLASYGQNPGISVVLAAGEEANKEHHASGDLREKQEQEIKLIIPSGQEGFVIEIWGLFGDRIEARLIPPPIEGGLSPVILLNEAQTYRLTNSSFVWSQGIKFDNDTGSQVIRFRLGDPLEGNWTIRIKGIRVIEGRYHIWIPKTGMILPETVLSPASPFTTIYNTSATIGLITVAAYDKRSLSPTPSSGRGFTRDNRIKPDFIVEAVDIPGPLLDNKWGLITGTSAASAITVGVCSLVYESQIMKGVEFASTPIMKAILVGQLKREPTLSYPNPSWGYGLLDINSNFYE